MAMFVSMLILAILSHITQPSTTTRNSTMANMTASGLPEENDISKSETTEGPSIAVSVLTVISLSTFLLFHSVGFNVIPFILMGELCPVKLKSLTSGKENKDKLTGVAPAVNQVMKFRSIGEILQRWLDDGNPTAFCITLNQHPH